MTMICPDCGNMIAYNSYFSAFYCPRCGGIFKKVKPMTNADRIRAMSDEELRNWLFQRDCTNIAAFLEYGGMGVMNAVQLLDWLQQPAE